MAPQFAVERMAAISNPHIVIALIPSNGAGTSLMMLKSSIDVMLLHLLAMIKGPIG